MLSRDPWYMGVTLQYGPDGSVFSSDWSDTGECHSTKNTRRHTGRIYKIRYGRGSATSVDLARLSNDQLVELQLHQNDWHVRHARRLLHERTAAGHDMTRVHRQLHAQFADHPEVPRKLRALWALYVTKGLSDEFLTRQLRHASEYVRAWAIQLLCEDRDPPREAFERFRHLAVDDRSPLVRLYLACALQRLEAEERWPIAEALVSHVEDATDDNLPLMIWYGVEPLVEDNLERFVAITTKTRIPILRRHIARRAVSGDLARRGIDALIPRVALNADSQSQLDLLTGILRGIEGRRSMDMPSSWPKAYERLRRSSLVSIRQQALQLALIFDDSVALELLRTRALDRSAPAKDRNRAIQALVTKKANGLAPLLIDMVGDPATQGTAIRGLAEYNHPATSVAILDQYHSFSAAVRLDALQTLASRTTWALELLKAIQAKQIPHTELTAYTARQLGNLSDDRVNAMLREVWGEVRPSSSEKSKTIARYKKLLSPKSLARADRSAGRAVFQQACANCHRLFDSGESIGPEITGSQRSNVDYLLENLVDPSSAVSRDYQMQIIETVEGRVISGLVVAETETALTLQTVNEKLVVPLNEILSRASSSVSLMPDGLLQPLSNGQIRNLVAYLRSPRQVSLPPEGKASE